MVLSKKMKLAILAASILVLAGCTTPVTVNTGSTGDETHTGEAQNSGIKVNVPEYKDIEDLLTYDEKSNTLICKDGFVKYQWFINGTEIANSNGFYSLNSDSYTQYSHNSYFIMVVVTDVDGNIYSDSIELTTE